MLLLDSYLPTLAFTVGYLLVVWVGPKYMKHRPPYSCRGAMMLYNLAITTLSLGMFCEVNGASGTGNGGGVSVWSSGGPSGLTVRYNWGRDTDRQRPA